MNINQKAIDLLKKNEYEEALKLFQKAVEESRNVQSLTNLAWIYCYEEDDDEFIGAIEVAELYVELGYFEQAIHWFEIGWKSYWKQPDWISRFMYSLLKTNNIIRAEEIVKEAIQEKNKQLDDARRDAKDIQEVAQITWNHPYDGIISLEVQKGNPKMFINVEKENEVGKHFYRSKGFIIVDEFEEDFDGHKLQTIRMMLET